MVPPLRTVNQFTELRGATKEKHMAKRMVMAGKTNGKKPVEVEPQEDSQPGPDRTKYSGELDHPVQVNFTTVQKDLLIKHAKKLGCGLATLVRMRAMDGLK